MAKSLPTLLLSLLVLIAPVGTAGAQQEPNAAKGDAAAAEITAVDELALAHDLAEYGRHHDSAMALAVAAQIVAGSPQRELESLIPERIAGAEEADEKHGSLTELDPAALIEEAEGLAAGNDAVLAVIGQVEERLAERARGDVAGAGCYPPFRVNARATRWFDVVMQGGRPAQLWVEGDGDTDIDCWVYDENGNLIVSDTDYTYICLLQWTPSWTGPFDVKVRNLGGVWTAVQVCTN